MKAGGFKELLVWQQSIELTDMIYDICRRLPKEELYGLGLQMRRSAASVPANIAEGSGRGSKKEFVQHLRIAYGSLCELETHVIITQRQKLVSYDWQRLDQKLSSVSRLLKLLIQSLKPPT
jgi:four helix bundle protein